MGEVINDFVHGKIRLPNYISKIIKSPYFQRLKKVKQLGLLSLVVPEATYTRYEHSIGTYYVASKMLDSLEANSSEWFDNISSDESELYLSYRKAVEVAALLHDIGHGPFSHVWEHVGNDYNHEENGANCIDEIFKNLDADETLQKFRDNDGFGIELVKALIVGGPPSRLHTSIRFQEKFNFIFEIVHNNQCELDVDKLDYLKRDSLLAEKALEDFENIGNQLDTIFYKARISKCGQHIEYRYEDYENIYKLFEVRYLLHKKFYRMPKVLACDKLFKDIIQNGNFCIDTLPLKEIRSQDREIFLKFVDDEIFKIIRNHEKFKYLENTERIVPIDNEDVIKVFARIKGPGAMMPSDDKFHFYGQSGMKTKIKRDLRDQSIYECYRLE